MFVPCGACNIPAADLNIAFPQAGFGPQTGTLVYDPATSSWSGSGGGIGTGFLAWTATLGCDPTTHTVIFTFCSFFSGTNWCCDVGSGLVITSQSCGDPFDLEIGFDAVLGPTCDFMRTSMGYSTWSITFP